jgi:hypothetical protein
MRNERIVRVAVLDRVYLHTSSQSGLGVMSSSRQSATATGASRTSSEVFANLRRRNERRARFARLVAAQREHPPSPARGVPAQAERGRR